MTMPDFYSIRSLAGGFVTGIDQYGQPIVHTDPKRRHRYTLFDANRIAADIRAKGFAVEVIADSRSS